VDLQNLRKSKWNQGLGKTDTACGSTGLLCEQGRRTVAVYGITSSQSSHGEESISSPTDLAHTHQDLKNPYHLIQIKEGDEYTTALRTQYRQFEY